MTAPLMMICNWIGRPKSRTSLLMTTMIAAPAERSGDRSLSARERDAADHGSDDRIELEALPDPVVDEADIAAQDQPGDRGEAARDHVAGDRDPVGVDADEPRRDRIAADDIDPAAERRSRRGRPRTGRPGRRGS